MKITTKLIAEIGSNHNRSLNRCFKIIDEAKNFGFYAVKFQLFKIDKLFSKEAKKTYKIISKKRKRELPISFLPKLFKYCKKKKIKFGCTPFDLKSVEILKPYVDFYKIASYEMNWKDLLEACANTKKPIILSTGMATFNEVKKALRIRNISDIKRKNSPLLRHRDSVEIDTGKLDKSAMLAKMSKHVEKMLKKKYGN